MFQSVILGQSFLLAYGIAHWTYGTQKGIHLALVIRGFVIHGTLTFQ